MPDTIERMSYKDYDARPGLRAGYLAALDKGTPGGAEYRRTHETDTAAMRWGSALHCMVLEPDRFVDEYTVGGPLNPKTQQPYGSATKAFNEWALTQVKPILTREEYRLILGMADAIMAHPVARTIRDAPRRTELSIFWEQDELPCKARLDCLQDGTIWDIKTTRDASYRGFERSMTEYRYMIQAAWYMQGAGRCGLADPMKCRYLWLAVENAAPYQLCVYRCSLDLWQVGYDRCEAAIAKYLECQKTKVWPTAFSQEPVLMQAPRWMLPDDDALEG